MSTKINPNAIAEGSISIDKIENLSTRLENIESSAGGGSSNANVQAVDTGDALDDVNVEYATTAYVDNKVANISLTDYATITYVDGLLGDINSVLESIIGGASGGSSSGGTRAYIEVNHGTNDTTFTLTPNAFHIWGEVSELTLTLGTETSSIANEYLFQFTSGSTPTTLTLPSDIKFSEDLVVEANKIYQISILKGLGSVLEFANEQKVATITFKIRNFECVAEEGMTWEQWVSSEYNLINCAFMGNNVHRMGEIVGTSYTTYVVKTDVIISDFAYILIASTL